MELTWAHWAYLAGTVIIILTMLARKNVLIPAMAGTFVVAWLYTSNLVQGIMAVFLASLSAAAELFNIFLIIALMTALLKGLQNLQADERMIRPVGKVMINGHLSYLVLAAITYLISLFFWPTPAVPLVAAILLPAAIRAGLSPLMAAIAISLAGQGMALSSDYIIQVAPELSATSAGVEVGPVSDTALLLSLVTGITALLLAYLLNRRTGIAPPGSMKAQSWMNSWSDRGENTANRTVSLTPRQTVWSRIFAVGVPLVLLAMVAFMLLSKFSPALPALEGGSGAAFVGGTAALLMVLATLAYQWKNALHAASEHVVEGFLFAFRAMGTVLPIAGFFFVGSSSFSGHILSLPPGVTPPSFLFDLVEAGQHFVPEHPLLAAFSLVIIGMITGLDGSGFSGLPLTGALAGAIGSVTGVDPVTLAALGQMGAIWVGGGTLIAWSSLVAVAGFSRVPVLDLVRKNFLPVLAGLFVSTLVAVFLL